MAFLPAAANTFTPSQTVTETGIPTGNAISSVTTSTCMWLRIPTVTSRNSVLRNSFWIPLMMPTLSMNTVGRKTSRLLLTSIPVTPVILPRKTISPLMTMASLSVSWAHACIKMDMRLLNTGRTTDARNQTANAAVSVSIPAHRRNTAEPYTSSPMTIQGYLTYRQGTVTHGKRNMTE